MGKGGTRKTLSRLGFGAKKYVFESVCSLFRHSGPAQRKSTETAGKVAEDTPLRPEKLSYHESWSGPL